MVGVRSVSLVPRVQATFDPWPQEGIQKLRTEGKASASRGVAHPQQRGRGRGGPG